MRKAGIVGMGGAGFPTAVKLSPKEPEKMEYVIVNCAECEPYLDIRFPSEDVRGAGETDRRFENCPESF